MPANTFVLSPDQSLGFFHVSKTLPLLGYCSVNVERGLVSISIEIIEAQLIDSAVVSTRYARARNRNSPAATQRGSFLFIESCHTLVSFS